MSLRQYLDFANLRRHELDQIAGFIDGARTYILMCSSTLSLRFGAGAGGLRFAQAKRAEICAREWRWTTLVCRL